MPREEILKVAKARRIEVHPDRLKRREGLSEEEMAEIDQVAMEVEEAALTLSGVREREVYDAQVRAWDVRMEADLWYEKHGVRKRRAH